MSGSADDVVQEHLGHRFADPTLLERALTHASWAHERRTTSNERLEHLGDGILQACMTIALFERFPDAAEGTLSRFRARLVTNEASLAVLGRRLDLGPALRLGRGEESSGGRDKDKVLANATEALLGALYLDAGFDTCLTVVKRQWARAMDDLAELAVAEGSLAAQHPKNKLQEETQRRWQIQPDYRVVRAEGPDHAPTYEVEVWIGDRMLGRGFGANRHKATHLAAVAALEALAAESA